MTAPLRVDVSEVYLGLFRAADVNLRRSGARGRPAWRRRMLVATVLAVGLGGTSSVQATNFGSEGIAGVGEGKSGVWFTENSTFIVAKRAMTAVYSAGVSDALIDEYSPTDLIVGISTTDACVDANHDTCVYDDDYGDNGLNGWNAC